MKTVSICLLIFFLSTAINLQSQTSNPDYHIKWDENSLVCIAEEGGYPRMTRLKNDSLLVVYENRKGDVVVKKSGDCGKTWGNETIAFKGFEFIDSISQKATIVNIANPEIIQLHNGDILLATNLRPRNEGVFPFSIALKRSNDGGNTWSDANIIFRAGKFFRDGCWEPSFLLLPDGMLHIYFANESPYEHSNEQEITVLRSANNGITWGKNPRTVSFRQNHRDGMPVAVHNGEKIFVVIEDNALGQFKPYLISNIIDNAWEKPVTASSSERYSALRNPLPDSVYAGAPYLIKTENNIYLISYQTTENRTSEWEHSTMEVVISDKPSDFRNPTQPFKVPLSREAKWNSLASLGNNQIAALASTNFNSDKIGVWMIIGNIIVFN